MEPVDRRDFMKSVAATAALAATERSAAAASSPTGLVLLTTWEWGANANHRAAEVLQGGGSLLDSVEKGINVVEDDPAVTTVGYGGLPNADGVVELDAAIMDGTRRRAGSVCSLHMIKNPISVARQVIERTSHTTMAGEGAFLFALKLGFKPQQLLTPESLKKWMDWKADPNRQTFWLKSTANHDTIGMVGTDGRGHVAAGGSTSGLAFKIPGRVAQAGHAQERPGCKQPPPESPAGQPRENGADNRPAGCDRGDDVAYPVNEVQKCALRLSARFTLNGHVGLGRPAEVLRPGVSPAHE